MRCAATLQKLCTRVGTHFCIHAWTDVQRESSQWSPVHILSSYGCCNWAASEISRRRPPCNVKQLYPNFMRSSKSLSTSVCLLTKMMMDLIVFYHILMSEKFVICHQINCSPFSRFSLREKHSPRRGAQCTEAWWVRCTNLPGIVVGCTPRSKNYQKAFDEICKINFLNFSL